MLRGTYDKFDVLTDLAATAQPVAGGYAHWGMWRSAQWLLKNHLAR